MLGQAFSKRPFGSSKCDSTEHSVQNYPSCAPVEADRLLREKRSDAEKKVKLAHARSSSGEVMTTGNGVEMSRLYWLQDRIVVPYSLAS